MTEFKAILPSEDGILLRPQVRKKLKLSRQKKVSKAISSLPPPLKRGRRKQDAAFRNRVGKRAQALRKVCVQNQCQWVFPDIILIQLATIKCVYYSLALIYVCSHVSDNSTLNL